MKYTQHITPTPQTRPLIGRKDMVKNNAGGYGFKITPEQQLERFLTIGTEGGTYYADEKALTIENAQAIVDYIKSDGVKVVSAALDSLVNNRAPKADPALFVLALAMTHGSPEVKKAAYNGISVGCRTATHLFTLVGYVNDLRGWSKGLCKGVSRWYTTKSSSKLAYQLVKYRQRNGWTHRDVLRLAHPRKNAHKGNLQDLLRFAVGKADNVEASQLITDYQRACSANVKDLIKIIESNPRITWEMIPTGHLNDPQVLEVLVQNMPLTATIRNLNRFANAGLTHGNSNVTKLIVSRLMDKDLIKAAGLHPVNVCNSMMIYARGTGFKGSQTWTPSQNIVDALNDTFYGAIEAMPKTNKNILIGVDTSGSMSSGTVAGTAMTAAQFSNVLALSMLKSEPNIEVIGFNTATHEIKFGRRSSLDEVLRMPSPGGGTDCSLPMKYAMQRKLNLDSIMLLTDSESWAGREHSVEALKEYRAKFNKDVKVIEVASTATYHSQFPTDDLNLLRISGFNSGVLKIIGLFLGQQLEDEEAA
jgi:60 kDa SS-A/Ro ribonucleoprotein